MTEKQAIAINLPVVSGTRATVTLPDGTKVQTSICEIIGIYCYNNIYYITIQTKNSIYRNIRTSIYTPDNNMHGQILSKGKLVYTSRGDYVSVERIAEVSDRGIQVIDSNGNILQAQI